jgi:hypothetical protein
MASFCPLWLGMGICPVWSNAWAAQFAVVIILCDGHRRLCLTTRSCISQYLFCGWRLDFYLSACSYVPASYVYHFTMVCAPFRPNGCNYIVTNPKMFISGILKDIFARLRIPYQYSLTMVRFYNRQVLRGISYYTIRGMLVSFTSGELEGSFA